MCSKNFVFELRWDGSDGSAAASFPEDLGSIPPFLDSFLRSISKCTTYMMVAFCPINKATAMIVLND